jgi:hypothetical protein
VRIDISPLKAFDISMEPNEIKTLLLAKDSDEVKEVNMLEE